MMTEFRPASLINGLERFPAALASAVAGLADEDASHRPSEDVWSIKEVVAHLADEEAEDFRVRLRLTLESPEESWPPIAPRRWALERDYRGGDLRDFLARFQAEREKSVAWLRGLDNPDWSSEHRHPEFGSMRAGDLLAAWSAHDILHLKQISKRLLDLAQRDSGGFSTDYAMP